ncbi:hypothetical protein BsWGS_13174 [Bradybaena similaris]
MKTEYANLRISVLGAKGVGKSAVTVRYLTKRFIGEYSSGLDISYQTTVCHLDTSIKVDILDTSSQGDCQAICHDVYDADAFVIVYSITDEVSLKVAKKEVEAIRSRSAPYTPVLLLGNKLDLEHARKVYSGDVEKLRETHGCLHSEVSAAESHLLIVNSFLDLVMDAFSSVCHNGRIVKRRKSLFENVSRKLGNVFRRKSLDSTPMYKKKLPRISYHNVNRRSV